MKTYLTVGIFGLALMGAAALVSTSLADPPAGKGQAALSQAASTNKTVWLVFYRSWDAGTATMAQNVKAYVDKNAARAGWTAVAIGEPAEAAVVERFKVGRAPMPLVLAVNPNGAVTGVFMQKVSDAELARCFVSPRKADCMKALQQNHLVLLCVQPSSVPTMPPGVQEFKALPHYADRTDVLGINLADPNEAAFLTDMQIDPRIQAPVTVLLAPPGVVVGTFPISASGNEMAAALHSAGKCCNDPNCKHHHR